MAAWFEFALYALKSLVSMVFSLDLGDLGFSFGDFHIAVLVISIVAVALIVKVGHFRSSSYG